MNAPKFASAAVRCGWVRCHCPLVCGVRATWTGFTWTTACVLLGAQKAACLCTCVMMMLCCNDVWDGWQQIAVFCPAVPGCFCRQVCA
jgi:hypothetical protein